jgi:hypothetical protein
MPKSNNSSGCGGCLSGLLLFPFKMLFGKGGLLDVPRTTYRHGKKRTYIPKGWPRDRRGRPLD